MSARQWNCTDLMHLLLPLPPSQLGGIASAKHPSSLAALGQISMTLSEPILDDSLPELTSVYDEHFWSLAISHMRCSDTTDRNLRWCSRPTPRASGSGPRRQPDGLGSVHSLLLAGPCSSQP